MKLTLTVKGVTHTDILLGLEEAARRIEAGNTSGFDSNETGAFLFDIEEGE
jgi:hypothetical protein